MPSSESGGEAPAKEAPKLICHWCFKQIEGTPVVLSYDIDLPQLCFHDDKEADMFHAAYFLMGEDNFLKKGHEKRMNAYEAQQLKKLARSEARTRTKNKTV